MSQQELQIWARQNRPGHSIAIRRAATDVVCEPFGRACCLRDDADAPGGVRGRNFERRVRMFDAFSDERVRMLVPQTSSGVFCDEGFAFSTHFLTNGVAFLCPRQVRGAFSDEGVHFRRIF